MNTVTHPIQYEIIRNRLLAVTEEMRIALQSVSGSPTVTEASDFFTGLYLPSGEFATMGFQVAHEAPPVGALIRHITAHRRPPRPGDMYIGNDPYVGALHQNDVQLAGPVFDGDRLVAWAGVMAHETDVGGMNFASWCPHATEVYQEGLRIPAVKLVDAGELRDDVLRIARRIGLTDAEITALRQGSEPHLTDPHEAAVAATTRQLLTSRTLTDTDYAHAAAALGPAKLFELTTLVGYYELLALQLRVFAVS